MSDKVFLDTNVLIYLYSEDEHEKADLALNCAQEPNVWISTQVLNEVSNVLRRKQKLAYSDVLKVIQELQNNFQIATVTSRTIEQALLLGERYGYSYFDCLMLASSLEQSCLILYSEDMQHGQIIEGSMRIVNPFEGLR
jgi:predicted nucleic acid-binding protein